MELSPKHFDTVHQSFLASWNLERIKKMTIEEYADLSNHDSLCYWLEYGTKQLGAIGRISLNKFELWRPKEEKEFRDERFKIENGYAWNGSKGTTLKAAFTYIRQQVVEIVTYSQQQNWQAVDDIRFHAIGKWKLAFLFSNKKLLPVYSMRALLAISNGLGYYFTGKEKVSVIQAAILSKKPETEDVVEFSYRIYTQFASRKKKETNYYIIGSKYGNNSVISTFLTHNCIGLGWLDWLDFSDYMGASEKQVNRFVEENWEEDKPPLSKIKGYFRLFSQIAEGDIIAIKSQGSFNQLKIIAYAQVVKRNV